MPLYEYRCPSCDHVFEVLRRASQMDAPAECPQCGEARAERQMSAPSFFGGASTSGSGGGCAPRGGFT